MNTPIEAKKALEVKDRVWRVVVAAGAVMPTHEDGRQHEFPMATSKSSSQTSAI
jgi:hypothetical protein